MNDTNAAIIIAVIVAIILIFIGFYYYYFIYTGHSLSSLFGTSSSTNTSTNTSGCGSVSSMPFDAVVNCCGDTNVYYINSTGQMKYRLNGAMMAQLGNPHPVNVSCTLLNNITEFMGANNLPIGLELKSYVSVPSGSIYYINGSGEKYEVSSSEYQSLGSPSVTPIQNPSELAILPDTTVAPYPLIKGDSFVQGNGTSTIYYINSAANGKYRLDPSNYAAAGSPAYTVVDNNDLSLIPEEMTLSGSTYIPTVLSDGNNVVTPGGNYLFNNNALYPYGSTSMLSSQTNVNLSNNIANLIPKSTTSLIKPSSVVRCGNSNYPKFNGGVYYVDRDMYLYHFDEAAYGASGNPSYTNVSCYEMSLLQPGFNSIGMPHEFTALGIGVGDNISVSNYGIWKVIMNNGVVTLVHYNPTEWSENTTNTNVTPLPNDYIFNMMPQITGSSTAQYLGLTVQTGSSAAVTSTEFGFTMQTGLLNGQFVRCNSTGGVYVIFQNQAYHILNSAQWSAFENIGTTPI